MDAEQQSTTLPLLVEVRERVAIATMNRPKVRNALNQELVSKLARFMTDVDEDDSVDVVVLTGADPAFCAGLDLRELESGKGIRLGTQTEGGRWPRCAKPLIGAINGAAVTGGLEIALSCDFLIASERAYFADTHTRVGIQPGWGLSYLLPQAVGLRNARYMSATGSFVGAGQAQLMGLVTAVVAHDDLLSTVFDVARDVVANDAMALRTLMAGYEESVGLSQEDAMKAERRRGKEWQSSHFDPTQIRERRQAIITRGSSKIGPEAT